MGSVGGVLLLVGIGFGIWYCQRKKSAGDDNAQNTSGDVVHMQGAQPVYPV